MKKKNVLTMALSVSLVGVIAVGGTLAYLSANTGTLTNTFTFTTNGINLNLSESTIGKTADNGFKGYNVTDYNDEGDGETDGKMTVVADKLQTKGIAYTDIVPGAVISKQPFLTVPHDTVNCYVYAVVDGITASSGADYYADFNTTNWTKVTVPDTYTSLFGQQDVTVLRYSTVVTTDADADQNLEPLFTKVTVANDATADTLAPLTGASNGIQIIGYAIQSDAFADNTAADTEALTYFNNFYAQD